ncbi:hypothetical protein DERF_002069 [Dermatophagoides farinae]|uniref:Uncharacterized protein n=1 Tax=Dermatophagoides farinae TaxID=6954 RepID=A0A922LA95_DERFA|nr:hypothetical protein DERF_002069 [Dermatophagoides farinae]
MNYDDDDGGGGGDALTNNNNNGTSSYWGLTISSLSSCNLDVIVFFIRLFLESRERYEFNHGDDDDNWQHSISFLMTLSVPVSEHCKQ